MLISTAAQLILLTDPHGRRTPPHSSHHLGHEPHQGIGMVQVFFAHLHTVLACFSLWNFSVVQYKPLKEFYLYIDSTLQSGA